MDNPLEARSPPPPQLDDEAPQPLSSLPTEILQRIIQLSLPRLSYKTFRERYDILLILCRVNKRWAALAQRELYSHVWLNHEVAGAAFLVNYSSSLASRTKSLRLNEEHPSPLKGVKSPSMENLMRVLPSLRELHLITKPDTSFDQLRVDLDALSRSCRVLETLVMDYCVIDPSPHVAPLQLSSLRHLVLSYFCEKSDPAAILETAQLPQLKSLVLIQGTQIGQDGFDRLTTALLRHAPRLKSFTLSFFEQDDQYHLPDGFCSALTSLEILVLDHNYSIPSILPLLPAPLRRLRIRPPFRNSEPLTFQPLIEGLKRSPPCTKSLKEILLPPTEASPETTPGPSLTEIQEERVKVDEICQQLGVAVVTVRRFEFENFMDHLEEALDFQ
ncbi:hypothetical protein BCR35DRAFT_348976 [Leucosporidium creatinivorum]|uniref:F-box domain-containing protein n=1 Tax=Leucosporidium creatinivorum TaxID=106004 RepID=A0A1Y2G6C3_9BASI|nr:hypothetical protein BCR35DRAFT_348976 [Leucosporidium creatinivorum]